MNRVGVGDAHRQKFERVKWDHSVIVVSSQKHDGWILHSSKLVPRPPDVVNRGEPTCNRISSNVFLTINNDLTLQIKYFQRLVNLISLASRMAESERALLDQILKIFLFVRATIVRRPSMSCR